MLAEFQIRQSAHAQYANVRQKKEYIVFEYKIDDDQIWKKINDDHAENGGVYILKSRESDGEIKSVNRFLKPDKNGILYIGKANSFVNRVIELKKSLSPEYLTTSHEAGARHKSHSAMGSYFPYPTLFVELIKNESPEKEESRLLNNYFKLFGELPPLNRAG